MERFSARRRPSGRSAGRRMNAAKPTQRRKITVSARNTSPSAITSACRRTISAICRVAASAASEPRAASAAVMLAIVSSAICRPQVTDSRNRSRCRSMRLSSIVLISARPTAPPRLRIRLKRPDAFLIFCGGMVPSARLLIGTMHSISEKPRKIWGHSSSQKSQSDGDVTRPARCRSQSRRSRSRS